MISYIHLQHTKSKYLILNFWGIILTTTNLSNKDCYYSTQVSKQQFFLKRKIFTDPARNLYFTAYSYQGEMPCSVQFQDSLCECSLLQLPFKKTRLFWEIKVNSVNSECFLWKACNHYKKGSVKCEACPLMMLTCIYTQYLLFFWPMVGLHSFVGTGVKMQLTQEGSLWLSGCLQQLCGAGAYRSFYHVGLTVPQGLHSVENIHHILPFYHLNHNADGTEHPAPATAVSVCKEKRELNATMA